MVYQMNEDLLEAEIEKHNRAYWIDNKPLISDEKYDRLVESLKKLNPKNPLIFSIIDDSKSKKIKHNKPMLSLDKVFGADDVVKWANSYGAFNQSTNLNKSTDVVQWFKQGGGVQVSLKADGCSCSLIYVDGKLKRAATRGNGKEGDDITANVMVISGIPHYLQPNEIEDLSGEIEVRGEILMTFKAFKEQLDKFDEAIKNGKEKESDRPSNPRNLAAGSIKHKDPEVTRSRNLSFKAHGAIGLSGTENQVLNKLTCFGFSSVSILLAGKESQIFDVINDVKNKIKDIPYPTDGLVFAINDTSRHEEIGCTGHHPKYRLAFKFSRENAETTIENIIWETSRKGKLCPVAQAKPIEIGGATVSLCTLHNAKAVKEHELCIGDTVKIEREVIPYFLGKTKSNNGKRIELPSICPSCNHEVDWDETETQLVCPNVGSCPAQLTDYICYYVSRKITNMVGVGEEIVTKLVDSGLVKSPADLFKLTPEALLKAIERQGDQSAKNVIESIQSRRTQDLAIFLASLGIDHLGTTISEKLAAKFGSLDKILGAKESDLVGIDKIGDKMALKIVNGLKERSGLIKELLHYVKVLEVSIKTGILTGKSFCCSGSVSFEHNGRVYDNRPDIQDLIKDLGGEVKSSVGKGLTALIAGDGAGSKIEDAKKKGIQIMSGEEFQKLIS